MCISRSTSVHATTVTGKTPSLTVVQMIVDSLLEDVTPHKVIAKKAGCSVLYQSISMKRWTGREECRAKRGDQSLHKSVKSTQEELHNKWAEVGVRASKATCGIKATTVKFLKFATPETMENIRCILQVRGLKRKRNGLLLSGPGFLLISIRIKVLEFGWRMERHTIKSVCGNLMLEFNLWLFRVPCHLLVLMVAALLCTIT